MKSSIKYLTWIFGLRLTHVDKMNATETTLRKYRSDAAIFRRQAESLEKQLKIMRETWKPKQSRDPETGQYIKKNSPKLKVPAPDLFPKDDHVIGQAKKTGATA